MARPKKVLTEAAGKVPGKVPAKKANPHLVAIKKALISDESWVTAVMIDAENRTTQTGLVVALYRFEVIRPLVHQGRQLTYVIHEKLELSIELLDEQFPNVNWLNAMGTYSELGAVPVRLHITTDPPRIDEHGNEYDARNRVMSVYAQKERQVKGTQTVETAEDVYDG